jgi:hypothetical protein
MTMQSVKQSVFVVPKGNAIAGAWSRGRKTAFGMLQIPMGDPYEAIVCIVKHAPRHNRPVLFVKKTVF